MSNNGEELCALSAVQAQREIASGALSPVVLTEAVLRRAEQLQPTLNCFITLCPEQALDAALASERRLAKGAACRPLEGIPLAVKDLVNTAGVRTTFGSLLHADHVPNVDAVAIARLRAAGAVLIGKTTTPEFGHKAFTDAPLFGVTANAWHAGFGAGGSSGGAAVAAAHGIAPLGVATDGGGSTRIPAACNGLVGIKQTAGVIAHSQTPDPFGNYTYVTPMTRTVDDTRRMLAVMAGADRSDPWSYTPAQNFASTPLDSLAGTRIWLIEHLGNDVLALEMRDALHAAAATLQSRGAHVELVSPQIDPIEPLWRVINHSTWRARFGLMVEKSAEQMTPTLVQQVQMAENFTAAQLSQATFRRGELFRKIQAWFESTDILLMPTLARAALPLRNNLFDPVEIDGQMLPEVRAAWFPYTMPFNLSGHPAVSIPVSRGELGLPLSVQLVGRPHEDARLLEIAALLEADTGWDARLAVRRNA